MKFFTKFSMKNVFVVLLAVILIFVGGIYSGLGIKEEAMPNISIPVVTVFTVYPGAAPNDIADSITRPIQKSLSGIQGITNVKGISNENVSIIVAEFDYSADIDKGQRDIEEAVNKVTIPENAQKPTISKVTMGSFPVMTYSVQSTKSINELSDFINSKVKPEISGVTGVSGVDVKGIKNDDVYIKLDEQKMKDNNITLQAVQSAINANNISYPLGSTEVDKKELAIRLSRKFNSIDDIKSVPVIVMPNTTKLMGDSFNKIGEGMNQLGEAVGQLGESMGQLAQGIGTTSKSIGEMIGNNTQAIAMLSVIQQQEGIILSQQAVLSNPKAAPDDQQKAKAAIEQANKVIQSTANSLQQVLSAQSEKGKELSSSVPAAQAPSNTKGKSSVSSTNSSEDMKLKVVYLKDIADIYTGDEAANFFARSNFKEGIVLNIYKLDDSNTVQITKDVEKKIEEFSKDNKDVKFSKIKDSSIAVKDSVNGMMREGITGAIFAMLVIALFLRDVKSTIIAVVSIPLSILIALILLPRFGITLNTMSLGGIAVAVGRIVDDSIVVIENIYRKFSLSKSSEIDKAELIEEATHEVGSAIAASTITTVGVFLPLSFISGLIGKVFIPFAYTVVICIIASLFAALTVVPVMSRFMLSDKNMKHIEKEGIMAKGYKKLLNSVLNHRFIVIALSLLILVSSFGLLKQIGIQFMPASNSNVINIKLTLPVGTSAYETNEEAKKFEDYLKSRNDIENVASIIGDTSSSGGNVLSNQSANVGSFIVVLKDNINVNKALDELNAKAKEFNKDGRTITVTPENVTNQSESVEVIIHGSSIEDITKASGLITDKLKNMEGLNNVTNNISQRKPEISISVDAAKAADKGITPAMAAGLVRSYLGDTKIASMDNGSTIDVMLGYKSKDIDSVDKIKNLEIQGMGDAVKIGDIAEVQQKDGPATISELNGKQYASVVADIKGNNTSKVTKDAGAEIESIKSSLPEGITYELQGSNKNIDEGFSQMGMAMFVAITLVYIVMVITFGEPLTPFAILFSLPFAGVGAIIALYIAKQPLTVSGMIGMLMLIGIVVTNAIVLLDRVKTNRTKGMCVREALLEAGSVRLRPILMTAIATVMALIPLALGFSKGSLISQGLGIVVIGGLVFSTILTLIIVPVMYSILIRDKK